MRLVDRAASPRRGWSWCPDTGHPRPDQLAALEPADRGDRPHRVPLAFGVPGGDAGIQQRIVEGKEQLGVAVQAVAVAAGYPLGEHVPVPGWQLASGAVGPVFGDDLVGVGQAGAIQELLVDLFQIGAAGCPSRPTPPGRSRAGTGRADFNPNGTTVRQCGVRYFCWAGHSVAPGAGRGTHSGCQRSGSTTLSQVLTG